MSEAALGKTYDRLTIDSYSLYMPDAPKAMADMVEALAGAVLVDNGMNVEVTFKVQ